MNKPGIAYRLLFRYAKWAYVHCYCRLFEVHGLSEIPKTGATIFVTNHQNNLPDALSLLFASQRKPVFVARADFFNTPISNKLLRFLRILPMYRADHGRESLKSDLPATMGELTSHLNEGGAIAVMAEGSSAPRRDIRPLKKSWARLAVAQQSEHHEVHVIPTVIEYSDWQNWGPDVRVTFGSELKIDSDSSHTDAQKVKMLTDLAHARLSEMISDDNEIALWNCENTANRTPRTVLWRILSPVILPLGYILLAPILVLAQYRIKKHSRVDFKSTLQIGFILLGAPVWLLILAILSVIVNLWLPIVTLILAPSFIWLFARCSIAWRKP